MRSRSSTSSSLFVALLAIALLVGCAAAAGATDTEDLIMDRAERDQRDLLDTPFMRRPGQADEAATVHDGWELEDGDFDYGTVTISGQLMLIVADDVSQHKAYHYPVLHDDKTDKEHLLVLTDEQVMGLSTGAALEVTGQKVRVNSDTIISKDMNNMAVKPSLLRRIASGVRSFYGRVFSGYGRSEPSPTPSPTGDGTNFWARAQSSGRRRALWGRRADSSSRSLWGRRSSETRRRFSWGRRADGGSGWGRRTGGGNVADMEGFDAGMMSSSSDSASDVESAVSESESDESDSSVSDSEWDSETETESESDVESVSQSTSDGSEAEEEEDSATDNEATAEDGEPWRLADHDSYGRRRRRTAPFAPTARPPAPTGVQYSALLGDVNEFGYSVMPVSPPGGTLKVIIFRMAFTTKPTVFKPKAQIEQEMWGSGYSVKSIYERQSEGKVSVPHSEIVDIVVELDDEHWCDARKVLGVTLMAGLKWSQTADKKLFKDYGSIVMFTPPYVRCKAAGIATVNSFGKTALSWAIMNGNAQPYITAHELGHTLGMNHASVSKWDDGSITMEYGYSDFMGQSPTYANAPHVSQLGWVQDSKSVIDLTYEGIKSLPNGFMVKLNALTAFGAPDRIIRIKAPGTCAAAKREATSSLYYACKYYYVSFRSSAEAPGLDSSMRDTVFVETMLVAAQKKNFYNHAGNSIFLRSLGEGDDYTMESRFTSSGDKAEIDVEVVKVANGVAEVVLTV